jgi:hypothetical protein
MSNEGKERRGEPSRLRKNYCDTVEFHWPTRLGHQKNIAQDTQKVRPARPQRAKRRRRTLRYVELLNEVRTPLADFFSILLLNARLALQPPDILHDLIDILRGDAVDLRHVAEFPMVRLDAVGCRQLEGLIPMMVRLVDLMH